MDRVNGLGRGIRGESFSSSSLKQHRHSDADAGKIDLFHEPRVARRVPVWNEGVVEAAIERLSTRERSNWGFRTGARGTHSSRTMMFAELQHLLQAVPADEPRAAYLEAVLADNCLGKRTRATRQHSIQRLSELYALDSSMILFRVLRVLWASDSTGRPLLALLLALARDPLLRATAPAVLNLLEGAAFDRDSMLGPLENAVGDRLNAATLDKVVRNAASTWTQSGHLKGRVRKVRARIEPTPQTTTYALLIAFALGRRGPSAFESGWAAVLDAEIEDLIESASAARRLGLLDLKHAGSIIDVAFPALLSEKEREELHGAYRAAG
jgi:hypothetical protein